MEFYELFYIFAVGLLAGFLPAFVWVRLERKRLIKKAHTEGRHIFQEAVEKKESLQENQKKDFLSKQQSKFKFFEKKREQKRAFLQDWREKIEKKAYQCRLRAKELKSSLRAVRLETLKTQRAEMDGKRQKKQLLLQLKEAREARSLSLHEHFSDDLIQLKELIKRELEENWFKKLDQFRERQEAQDRENLQKNACFLLNIVLSRFDRMYCSERGIPAVKFRSLRHLEKAVGKDEQLLQELEKECGADVSVHREDLEAVVFGIDPVRRELARMSLKKLSNNPCSDKESVRKLVHRAQKELFSKISQDGRKICRKLGLSHVMNGVQNMMGALRYRYSFAQNQYFHCEETGWLCGLLSAELGLPVKSGQRAGMLHDIGKAMDHSIEGNHAVIGADFLSKHREKEEIVQAVRSHHHDVPPSSALAWLVIVADAISGSRPGARRFTEDSYNRKMSSLEKIIASFENIEDAYIMGAGREMRVIVDSQKTEDRTALELSRKITEKIEKECSYPGLIKVTVVRRSEVSAIA